MHENIFTDQGCVFFDENGRYYESLKSKDIPTSWFAGDLMHYLFAGRYAGENNVLDAGCGLGYGAYHLSLRGASQVTGVDLSEERIESARIRFQGSNLNYMPMDIGIMGFDSGIFDLVVNFEVLEHIAEPDSHVIMKEILRVLKPNGRFIISTPNRDVYSMGSKVSSTEGHVNEMSCDEFIRFVREYFQTCCFYYQYRYSVLDLLKKKEQEMIQKSRLKRRQLTKLIPRSVKNITKQMLKKEGPEKFEESLVDQMERWQIFPARSITDLRLSVIQLAVCEKSF